MASVSNVAAKDLQSPSALKSKSIQSMNKIRENSLSCDEELHIAPMLDVSNTEFHHFFRILSKKCVLWTEMVVDETLAYSSSTQQELLLEESSSLQPIVFQMGGQSPQLTGMGTKTVNDCGLYNEINLNCECPSGRVAGKREFGAALMKKQALAIDMVKAMSENAQHIPISIKTRIGVDDKDSLEFLVEYIRGFVPYCKRFVLHARKVYLKGLNPAQNRSIPPLNYPRVYQLCKIFPDCDFWINGGITNLADAKKICHGCKNVHEENHGCIPCLACNAPYGSCMAPPTFSAPFNLKGCMLGRAAVDHPALFWDVDRYFYGQDKNPCQNRRQVLDQYCEYLEKVYPPRCCDDNEEITSRQPAPRIVRTRDYSCPICKTKFYKDEKQPTNGISSSHFVLGINGRKRHERHSPGTKITSRVMDRSLKPVLNMFCNEPGSKRFKRAVYKLSRDLEIRNCGPSYILKKAIEESIANMVLDKDFLKTEDL